MQIWFNDILPNEVSEHSLFCMSWKKIISRSKLCMIWVHALLSPHAFPISALHQEYFLRSRTLPGPFNIFPGCSDDKESACNAGHSGLIPGSGRFSGEKNGYLLQYSCLENPKDRGVWQATVYGVAKSQTWLSS